MEIEVKVTGTGTEKLFEISMQPELLEKIRLCQEKVMNEGRESMTGEEIHTEKDDKGIMRDLKEYYWWPNMKRDVAEWVSKCLTCQRVKAEHQRPSGLLRPLEIPEWKWEQIAMDFVVGLPRTKANHDAIWVIIDRLTKSAHFIPINERYTVDRLVDIYLKEIVTRHGVPASIVSDRDPSIGMPPYEALYGRRCRSPLYWDEVGERKMLGPEVVQRTKDIVDLIRGRLVVAQDRQKKYADLFGDNNKGFRMGYGKLISENIVIEDVALVAVLSKKTGEVALKGARKGSLFVADLYSVNEDGICCFYTKASVEQSKMWHKKLSHLIYKAINTLVKKKLVRDMPNLELAQDEVCEAC
ncbi:hypothetical protein AgCh_013127 [Apium graveolens]